MAAGQLSKRIRFERSTQTPDGAGGFTEFWSEVTTVWGSCRLISAKEEFDHGRFEGSVHASLFFRYSVTASSLTEKDRAVVDGHTYSIIAPPQNLDQRKRYLTLIAQLVGEFSG